MKGKPLNVLVDASVHYEALKNEHPNVSRLGHTIDLVALNPTFSGSQGQNNSNTHSETLTKIVSLSFHPSLSPALRSKPRKDGRSRPETYIM